MIQPRLLRCHTQPEARTRREHSLPFNFSSGALQLVECERFELRESHHNSARNTRLHIGQRESSRIAREAHATRTRHRIRESQHAKLRFNQRLKTKTDEIKGDPRYQFMFSGMLVGDTMADFIGRIFRMPSNG